MVRDQTQEIAVDTSIHNMSALFQQLGLASGQHDIDLFIEQHKIAPQIPLDQAAFWNPSQREFIRESIAQDSDWSEIIDQLDALLR